jgi:UTP--glucose-1-phosphate uridylyltransferase
VGLVSAIAVIALSTGCGTTRWSDSKRTATEQLLISDAVERAVMQIDMRPLAGQTSFTRQQAPLGLGHAVWCAREIIGREPFALLLPDVLIKAERGCLSQMMDVYAERGGNVIAVEPVPADQTHQYGVCKIAPGGDRVYDVTGRVEKPPRGTAPSNLIITGRYLLQPEIFDLLETQEAGAGGEIQLTDAMLQLMRTQSLTALEFTGRTYDCGSKIGFLMANLAYAAEHPELGKEFRAAAGAYLAAL